MLRKRGLHSDAVGAFESALKSGDRAVSVYRDCADCLFRLGRFQEAYDKLRVVLDRNPENIYALDLVAKICIESRQSDDIQKTLDALDRYDVNRRFIFHRRATYLSSIGKFDAALAEAIAACETGHSPFEAYATKADILVEMRKFVEADAVIAEIEAKFGNQKRDVQYGLRCKLLIRKGQWKEALGLWERIGNHARDVYQRLLAQILEIKGKDTTVLLAERNRAEKEARKLFEKVGPGPGFADEEEPSEIAAD